MRFQVGPLSRFRGGGEGATTVHMPSPSSVQGAGKETVDTPRRLPPVGFFLPLRGGGEKGAVRGGEAAHCRAIFSLYTWGKEGDPSTSPGRLRLLSTQGLERGQRRCHLPTDGPFWQGGEEGLRRAPPPAKWSARSRLYRGAGL